jgi:hypothetical protein
MTIEIYIGCAVLPAAAKADHLSVDLITEESITSFSSGALTQHISTFTTPTSTTRN